MGSYLDMTIGVIGSITLTFLAGMIIITSLSFSAKTGKSSILEGAFGTGNITYISGGTLWGNFSSEPKLHYDRGNNTLTITSK